MNQGITSLAQGQIEESKIYDSMGVRSIRLSACAPAAVPNRIAVLRLDTDFYESTYHELCNLFHLLSDGGLLIVDDYGSWAGSREATDQYFAENSIHMMLHRIDEGARIGLNIPLGRTSMKALRVLLVSPVPKDQELKQMKICCVYSVDDFELAGKREPFF